jgi:glycosyltransferase involved in cell wall biosynthesis
MNQVFASADVLVAILEPDSGVFCVPSKVLSYMCAARALLLAVPSENLSARIVKNNHAGLVVPPDNVADFLSSAERLYTNAELRRELGQAARKYAEKNFDFQRICDRFETILQDRYDD